MKRGYVLSGHFEIVPQKVFKMEDNKTPMDVSVIVDHNRISKNSALSLVELAKQIEQANHFVQTSACTKLKLIADQVRYLEHKAECILMEAKQNMRLHEVSCNFVKQRGHIYHLYQRSSGELYFSMISPEEWGKSGPTQLYKGSFRLEHDQSWTPISEIPRWDAEMIPIENVVEKSIFASSKVPFILDVDNRI